MYIMLYEARMKKKITIVKLAEISGLSKSAINNYENGKSCPNLIQLEILAQSLGCRIIDLFESDYK